MQEPWRQLEVDELAVLLRLLDQDFPGRDELRAQIKGCEVKAWHDFAHCRSLEFRIASAVLLPEETSDPLAVEAHFTDSDGHPVDILLFQKERRLWAMEFVVYSERQIRMPNPTELDVSTRPSRL